MPFPLSLETEAIKARIALPEFVQGYVTLEPAGSGRWRACCPFHEERTPSFHVFENGTFKCYGCGAHGDIFRFVQEIENVSFIEAKRKLISGDMGIPISPKPLPRLPAKPITTWQEEVERAGLQPLRGTPGEKYLVGRGISFDVARSAKVKYAARWFGKPAVMFPIVGQYGEVLAVQGRLIYERDPKRNKLSKGPKSQGIFATAGALKMGAFVPGVAICEAPIDALSLLTLYGIPSIAVCGSDLTGWVLNAARAGVWIATDADKQGDNDFDQWAPLFQERGITAKRLRPSLKDWNEELLASLQTH